MKKLTKNSLWTLEHYARVRDKFRKEMIEHKKSRMVSLGENLTLHFEDAQTIKYQVQEILRIEKTFEEEGIVDELEAYNPLIPDGTNFKCTMMIEYSDEAVRREKLKSLKGIEDKVWVRVEGRDKVWAIADEDLARENDEKTSAVHFLRFELDEDMIKSLHYGVGMSIGVDHTQYSVSIDPVSIDLRNNLVKDLI
ncbi:MAG: hypothetical protein CMK54_04330 [Proteobacteria bacterium]|nr:hypothetical protein [Pseudomonadota bacterium]